MFFTVPADSPAKSLKDFIAYAKQNDGKLNIGSVGQGSFSHVTAEYFKQLAGLNMTHIPYNGGAPLMTAFAGGQVQAGFVTGLDGAALQRAGKVRYLAIATPQPSPVAPGVPTVAEVLPGFKSYSWFAIFAPKGTPDDIVARLNTAIVAAVARPEVQKFFADRNVEAKSSTPDGLAKLIEEDIAQGPGHQEGQHPDVRPRGRAAEASRQAAASNRARIASRPSWPRAQRSMAKAPSKRQQTSNGSTSNSGSTALNGKAPHHDRPDAAAAAWSTSSVAISGPCTISPGSPRPR